MARHEIATVAIIEGDHQQRVRMAHALRAYWRVAHFPDLETALGTMRHKPSLVLVDETLEAKGRRHLVRTLKEEPALAGALVVVRRAPARGYELAHKHDAPADAYVDKPTRRQDLIDTISAVLNHDVEEKWDALPDAPRKSLREALGLFSVFSDVMEGGGALNYATVATTCAPLITAVEGSQHSHVLKALNGHDNESFVHSMRVATLLTLFGHAIGLRDSALVTLTAAGLVHDLGKLSLPPELRMKADALTEDEFAAVRGHVTSTVEYLQKRSDVPKGVIMVAGQHHERLDGSGYPGKLKGTQLNDLARMGAIVDVFAAMTESRPYKDAMTPEKALETMMDDMRDQLDHRLVRLFREIVLDAAA